MKLQNCTFYCKNADKDLKIYGCFIRPHLVIFILVVLLKRLNHFQVRKTLCFRDVALFNTSNKTIKKNKQFEKKRRAVNNTTALYLITALNHLEFNMYPCSLLEEQERSNSSVLATVTLPWLSRTPRVRPSSV